jgi:transposase
MEGPAITGVPGLEWVARGQLLQSQNSEPGPMSKLRFVGLDDHKDTVVVEAGDRPAEVLGKWASEESAVLVNLKTLGPIESLKVCYEAGPTGYGIARTLFAAGINCVVVRSDDQDRQPACAKTLDRGRMA